MVDSIGKWCGGLVSFLAGRHCLRDLVARWLDGGGSPGGFGSLLSAVDRVLNSRGADSRESFQLLLLIELACKCWNFTIVMAASRCTRPILFVSLVGL